MNRTVGWIVILTSVTTCAFADPPAVFAPAGHQSKDETAVLETMDRYMVAVSANDLKTMAAMQTPDGMTYRARAAERGDMEVVAHPNSYWIDPAREDKRTYRERYWSPTVLIGAELRWYGHRTSSGSTARPATVASMCSILEDRRGMRVSNSMWTVEPGACAELRPVDPSQIRPAN
jgi:hypothetical protein